MICETDSTIHVHHKTDGHQHSDELSTPLSFSAMNVLQKAFKIEKNHVHEINEFCMVSLCIVVL